MSGTGGRTVAAGRVAALVPAAGLSSRMDGFKPLLPLGGATVLGCVVRALRQAGVEEIIAVAGHRSEEVLAEAVRLGIGCVVNSGYRQGMFSSVLAGMAALPDGIDAVLVLPVDIPLVRPQSIRSVLGRPGNPAVAYPAFLGERGHPPLIRTDCLAEVSAWSADGGLRAALATIEKRLGACDVAVADANILFDLDTPGDYREALHRAGRMGRPTPDEARALLEIHQVNQRGLAHAQAVARVALALAEALNLRDMELVHTSALLHDIAKGRPGHEAEGGRILESAGFPDAARIVAAHRDLGIPDADPITEREVVYLADKMVRGSTLVAVRDRFQEKLDLFGHDPEAFTAISGRRDRALAMLGRVERETGLSMEDILERGSVRLPGDAGTTAP